MLTSITIGLLGILVRAMIQIRKDKRRIEYYENQATINYMMRNCIRETRIERFLILKMTNGANELLNGVLKQHHVTALNEEFADINKSVLHLYQHVLVDIKYSKMVNIAHTEGYYDFITHEEEDCDLKRFYIQEGLYQARIFFVHEFKEAVYYCTVASYEKIETTAEEVEMINRTVEKIRESYRQYYR